MVSEPKKDKIGEKKSKTTQSKSTNTDKNKYTTHLYYHDKYLTNIKNIQSHKHLTTLYLHNNLITTIEKLDSLVNLSNLYLQRNKIKKIENLSFLKNLKKLYLSHNEISVVENLENLVNLEELYLEKQDLSNGDSLCFDPRSVEALSNKLQILNIASNNIHSIKILRPLKNLIEINVSNNSISDINDVCSCIENWYYLKEAWFVGNPISKGRRYREDIIGSSTGLKLLDDKQVHDTTRSFIKRFEKEKAVRGNKQTVNIDKEIINFDVPKNYPPPVQKAVYKYILHPKKGDTNETNGYFDDNAFVPWNSMPKTKMKMPLIMKRQPKSRRHNVDFNSLNTMFPNMFK